MIKKEKEKLVDVTLDCLNIGIKQVKKGNLVDQL